jgi:hypothetical protein
LPVGFTAVSILIRFLRMSVSIVKGYFVYIIFISRGLDVHQFFLKEATLIMSVSNNILFLF